MAVAADFASKHMLYLFFLQNNIIVTRVLNALAQVNKNTHIFLIWYQTFAMFKNTFNSQ